MTTRPVRSSAAPATDELPLVVPLADGLEAEDVFLRLAARPWCLFLDSARRDPLLGRYSFVTADPFETIQVPADGSNALEQLGSRLADFRANHVAGLPPFQGGAAGFWAYDLNRSLERIGPARYDEFAVPALAIGLYDVVVAFDHVERRAWIISQGFPEVEPAARSRRARERAAQFRSWLDEPPAHALIVEQKLPQVAREQLAPQFAVAGPDGLTSDFSRPTYLAAVERAIEYIRAGEIFQVNLAQRLLFPAADSSPALYMRLRSRNPAPFAGYFDFSPFQIASASPERFLKSADGEVETRPIKGTRQRTRGPEADLFAGDDLEQSEKDRAENVMIVDLLRNDLARVCRPESVRVTQLCRLESFEFVQHLVSAVCGTLREGQGPIDLLRATFPGGSITGAPKVRAMEIVAELEPTARGAYCGALGYIGFDGTLDTNILIRTIIAGRGWWQAPVGGGIVAQSVPEREYEETWHKAAGLIRALR
ncbi:MAG TPA: anthranilate synthase component I family protein [Pirellulales bacterium]|jgi:para-aminobenzoate synthetase component 1